MAVQVIDTDGHAPVGFAIFTIASSPLRDCEWLAMFLALCRRTPRRKCFWRPVGRRTEEYRAHLLASVIRSKPAISSKPAHTVIVA